jgi:hypothetical protein
VAGTRNHALAGALVALVLVATSPAAAHAAQAYVRDDCESEFAVPCVVVAVQAADGEANAVDIRRDRTGAVFITDRGAPLAARGGCAPAGDRRIRCEPGALELDLGDGDDSAALRGATRVYDQAHGGQGADRLRGFGTGDGGAGADTITGTRRPDFLSGGDGEDRLKGGGGDDLLSGDEPRRGGYADDAVPAADVIDGGPGTDVAAYERGQAVTVDLSDPGPDGSPGEGDRLIGIEGAYGGKGDDTLIGDAGANVFSGGGGNGDRIDCRGGDDRAAGYGDLLVGCERVDLRGPSDLPPIGPVRTRGNRLTLRLPCLRALRRDRRRGACRVVVSMAQTGARRRSISRRLPPGGGRVSVPVGHPRAPLHVIVDYPGSEHSGAHWRIPRGGRG